jgi:hypothetical protein
VSTISRVQAVLNGRVGAHSRVFTTVDDAHAWFLDSDDSARCEAQGARPAARTRNSRCVRDRRSRDRRGPGVF